MNRKSQMMVLVFAAKLVIALILVFFVFSIARRCVGNTSEATESFLQLVEKIRSIKEDEFLSTGIVMDKETAIIGFSKNSEEIIRLKRVGTPQGSCEKDKNCQSYVEKPEACDNSKACICYCTKYEAKKVLTDRDMGGYQAYCEKPICKNIDKINFPSEISELKLASYDDDTLLSQIPNPATILKG